MCAGRYQGIAFPHNVLRRGALQFRGYSGVFFERYVVHRAPLHALDFCLPYLV